MNGISLLSEMAYRRHVTQRAADLGISERQLVWTVEMDAACAPNAREPRSDRFVGDLEAAAAHGRARLAS